MKTYKGFYIDEQGIVRNRNGFKQRVCADGRYDLPPSEKLTIEQLKDKINGIEVVHNGQQASQTIHEEIVPPIKVTHAKPKAVTHEKVTHVKKSKLVTHDKTAHKFTHGESNPKFKGWFVVNGAKYNSTRAAELSTGIASKTIYNRCMANVKGFSFEPKQ